MDGPSPPPMFYLQVMCLLKITLGLKSLHGTFTYQLMKVSKLSCLFASLVLRKEGFE